MSHQPYASLQIRDFKLYLFARMCFTMAWQMQGVIVGWQVYEYTGDPFTLGLVGLAEVAPFITMSFYGGHVADVVERKTRDCIHDSLFHLRTHPAAFYPAFYSSPE